MTAANVRRRASYGNRRSVRRPLLSLDREVPYVTGPAGRRGEAQGDPRIGGQGPRAAAAPGAAHAHGRSAANDLDTAEGGAPATLQTTWYPDGSRSSTLAAPPSGRTTESVTAARSRR